MSYLLSPLNVYKHKIRKREIELISSTENIYRVNIEHREIRKTDFSDLIVNGPFGLEPAIGYSSKGTGTIFHKIQIEEGHAEMIIGNSGNQTVISPEGFKLLFVS